MLSTIRKLIQESPLNLQTRQYLEQQLGSISDRGRRTTDLVVEVCNILVMRAAREMENRLYVLSEKLVEIGKSIIFRTRNQEVFQIQLVKIKLFLLSFKLSRFLEKESSLANKIGLFLQAIEQHSFFSLLQEDFYSSLELIYLEAAKTNLQEGCPEEALKMEKLCFHTLKKQILALAELQESDQDQKIKVLLEKKGKYLESLFLLQYGTHLLLSQLSPNIVPSYRKLIAKTGVYFDPQQLIEHPPPQPSTIGEEDSLEEEAQQRQRGSLLQNRSRLTSEIMSEDILRSLQFVEQVQSRFRSSSFQKPFGSRTSLQVSQDVCNECKHRSQTRQSRFHRLSLEKENLKAGVSPNRNREKSGKIEFRTKKIREIPGKKPSLGLVLRMEEEERSKLKSLNPFKQFKQPMVPVPTRTSMIQTGIVPMGFHF